MNEYGAYLNAFKENMNGGTRTNKFQVTGNFPSRVPFGSFPSAWDDFHVRSAALPTQSLSRLEYDHMGRKIFLPGDRDFPIWTVQMIDDVGNASFWNSFVRWNNYINGLASNAPGGIVPSDYKADGIQVLHLDMNCNATPIKRYVLDGVWPKIVGALQHDMTRRNTANMFTVTFQVDQVTIDV